MTLPRQRVTLITLGVVDLARAQEFYAAWGWQPHDASQEGVAFYQMNGAVWRCSARPIWPPIRGGQRMSWGPVR